MYSYSLMTSLALYHVEPSGFLLVLDTHFDTIGLFLICACAGEKVSVFMIEFYTSMIAAYHLFYDWLSITYL
jgi:hypothetical protein